MTRFRVEGRVQGVGYRNFVERVADRLGLDGWVRNTEDGAVEGLAHGPPDALDALWEALRRGPPAAAVDRLVRAPAAGAGPTHAGPGFSRRATAPAEGPFQDG